MEADRDLFYRRILDDISDGVYFLDTNRSITYWSRGAERITGYPSGQVLGSSCRDNILMHVDESGTCLCEGLCPVTQTLADKTTRQADVFLHHREGHRVPVRIQVSPILDRNGNIVGAVEVFRETAPDSMAAQHIEDLKKAVLVDPMTGLLNRRFLDMKIQSCFEELHRHGFPFAVIFADVDHFRSINETHGHLMGDEVLKMVSRTLKENIRLSDTAGRWGGEEFLLIFQHLDGSELAQIAEKLRVLVETSFLTAKKSNVWVTISMGATMARKGETADSLLGRADQLMYRAKSEGRNRVFIN